MREVERIECILGLIKEIWMKNPDLRFTQLQDHLTHQYSDANEDYGKQYFYDKYENDKGVQFTNTFVGIDLFYVEDDSFEKFLEDYLKTL